MANVSVRIDDATKIGLDKFCKDIGISVSSLFNMFAKKVVREQRVPFSMQIDPFYSEENMAFLREAQKQIEEGKTVKMSFEEFEAMTKKGSLA